MTSFFNENERKIAVARMNRDMSGDTGYTVNKCMNVKLVHQRLHLLTNPRCLLAHIWSAFKDWKVSVLFLATSGRLG